MRKIILIIAALVIAQSAMTAQDNPDDAFSSLKPSKIKLRHIKGFYFGDASYCFAKKTRAYDLNFGYFITNKSQITVGGNYEFGKIGYTNVKYFSVNVGQQQTVYKLKHFLYVNTHVEGIVGGINYNTPELDRAEKQVFNYGFGAGVNTEIFLFNFCAALFSFQEQYHFKDDMGKFHYQIGVGLRFYVKP